jgi:hypothetical protein
VQLNVYVDGFNLYYGAVKGTAYRWLDLERLSQLLRPQDTIHRIRYFTALVDIRPSDPQQRHRQETYIRALETLPCLTVHYGTFLVSYPRMVVSNPLPGQPRTVEVIKTEEKGSDVNLATYLLLDAFEGDFDGALVVSNDSDLAEPIRMVRQKFGLPVGVASPYRRLSYELTQAASYMRQIRQDALRRSQFSVRLSDARGTITKPAGW